MAGYATPTSSAGHPGRSATADHALTLTPDHLMGAGQSHPASGRLPVGADPQQAQSACWSIAGPTSGRGPGSFGQEHRSTHKANEVNPPVGYVARTGGLSGTSAIWLVRARSSSITTRSSSRASSAPGQTWMPAP